MRKYNTLTLFSTALMEHFPTRIHAIYVIHAGFITKIMIGFAKLVFKKKMTKRVCTSTATTFES